MASGDWRTQLLQASGHGGDGVLQRAQRLLVRLRIDCCMVRHSELQL